MELGTTPAVKLPFENAIQEEIEELKTSLIPGRNGLFLFISFDLDNSTLFKSEAEDEWPAVIVFFYDAITKMTKEKIDDINIWKYLGDEIVLYHIVRSIEGVYDIPDILFGIQEDVLNRIRREFPKAAILDIKCTLWLAGVTRVKAGDVKSIKDNPIYEKGQIYRNIHTSIPLENGTVEDFLGVDMDTGFRIAKYSNKRKITLSAEYAYLLYHLSKPTNVSKIDNKLKVVAFKELKGIWNGRAYPIVWYYPDWSKSDASFDYDEHIHNEIIKDISRKKEIEHLDKVFEDAGQKEYMDHFIEICREYISEGKKEHVVGIV